MNLITLILLCFSIQIITAQVDSNIIKLKNPSFEDTPGCCKSPKEWMDCGSRDQTPPDIQPMPPGHELLFNVNQRPYDGSTYIDMVVRSNNTFESIGQKLSSPLLANQCYKLKIYLCMSFELQSGINYDSYNKKYNFNSPAILRIFGGNEKCERESLLTQSSMIDHIDWKEYSFILKPETNYKYLILEAFYSNSETKPYNGNILLDNASDLMQIPCNN